MFESWERAETTTSEEIVVRIREVGREARVRAEEIDRERRFPEDLFDAVEKAGCFRIVAPKEFGGLELPLSTLNEVVLEAGRGNGSLGWLLMVGSSQSIGNGLWKEEVVRENLEKHPDLRVRGVIAPKGIATPVEGGFTISGQWPFASGGPEPHVVGGTCIVMEAGKPRMTAQGEPELIMAMMDAKDVTLHDNWHTLGMRGTDSCDVSVQDLFVPEVRTYAFHEMHNCYDAPVSRLPLRVALSFPHSALALGIAAGALDDVKELARTKRASMNPTLLLAEDPMFLHALGEQTLKYTANKAFLDQATQLCWQAGVERRELSDQEILSVRLMASYITKACLEIVTWAYEAVGSTSVYENCYLTYRIRDMHICTQHASTFTDPYRLLGRAEMGEKLTPAELF